MDFCCCFLEASGRNEFVCQFEFVIRCFTGELSADTLEYLTESGLRGAEVAGAKSASRPNPSVDDVLPLCIAGSKDEQNLFSSRRGYQ